MSSNFRLSAAKREISSQALHTIRVEDLSEKGLDLHFSDPKEEWNQYIQEIPALEFFLREGLEAAIRVSVAGKAVRVQGRVNTVLDLQCCRCLETFSYPLTSQIDVTLFPEKDVVQEEEIELETKDLKTDFFSGDEIDLSGLIRELILLSIPYKALCREECRGICSQCGANLNEGNCACEREVRHSAFEALKNLKLNEK